MDKGVTWSAPIIADREPNKAYVYPNIGAVERRNDTAYVHYVYMYDEIPGSFVLSQNAKSVNNATIYNVQKFYAPTVGVNDNAVVNNFTLEQNYPNPFNPSTKISYSISERSNVSIKVFDMLGREVAELINSAKEAGSYEITFDASNLSSGLYIYTINAGNFSASKKMMLMK
ncbi:MAG: T9SS type A sorting domain-containing protein [Ignavibacteriales bacterium]|nr:T9SS type A sorting domain-containing protein [Ignavibacteriales bacterium]